MNNPKTLNPNAKALAQGRDCLVDSQSDVSQKIRISGGCGIGNDKRCSRVARRWTSATLRLRRLRS